MRKLVAARKSTVGDWINHICEIIAVFQARLFDIPELLGAILAIGVNNLEGRLFTRIIRPVIRT